MEEEDGSFLTLSNAQMCTDAMFSGSGGNARPDRLVGLTPQKWVKMELSSLPGGSSDMLCRHNPGWWKRHYPIADDLIPRTPSKSTSESSKKSSKKSSKQSSSSKRSKSSSRAPSRSISKNPKRGRKTSKISLSFFSLSCCIPSLYVSLRFVCG